MNATRPGISRRSFVHAGSAALAGTLLRPTLARSAEDGRKPLLVACIGDSITMGAGAANPAVESYPARLQELLGDGYAVTNLGVGSCTLIRKGAPNVWATLRRMKERLIHPDLVVVSLGINDTCGGDRKCWDHKDDFPGDYRDLIDELAALPSNPRIWICAPTPMVLETPGLKPNRIADLTQRRPRLDHFILQIKAIAAEKQVGFLDLNSPLAGHPEFFTDGVHMNAEGYHNLAGLVAGALREPQAAGNPGDARPPRLVLPTPAQRAWQEDEIGLLFSFDLAIAAGDRSPNNAARITWDPNLYQPVKLDTDQWIETARACGAKYAIFTATHFNGFMQWQSDAYPYGLKQTSWRGGRGDVVADFCASCRKADIRPGVFFSVHRNVYQKVWGHYVDWGKGRGTPAQDAFNRIAEKQMEEICSKYGPLAQIWFDAGTKTPDEGGPDMLPIFEKHQPDGVFYSSTRRSDHRWVGNEEGHAGSPCYATMPGGGGVSHSSPAWKGRLHGGDPDGTVWSPAMVDIPLRGHRGHNWFYKEGEDHTVHPPEILLKKHLTSVGRNANLIIGAVIRPDGTLPEADVAALAGFGRLVRERFGKPLAGVENQQGETVTLDLPEPRAVDCVVLQERIEQGELVRDHVVEGLVGETWVPLAQGKVIGHKWIHAFAPKTVSRLRLRVLRSLAPPHLRSFSVFPAE